MSKLDQIRALRESSAARKAPKPVAKPKAKKAQRKVTPKHNRTPTLVVTGRTFPANSGARGGYEVRRNCPACGRLLPLTAAERQRKHRAAKAAR